MSYQIGIVGAGNMGSGIAQKMAMEGLHVTMVDVNAEAVRRGMNTINSFLDEAVQRGVITEAKKAETLSRITPAATYEDLKDMDLVLEAVFEDKQVKKDLLSKLDGICGPDTVLATNTSSFYVGELAACTKRPTKVIGMHYFYHPAKNRLLEIIPHAGTSKETIELAKTVGRLHGKTTIVVKDSPGFAVNRFFIPFYVSCVRLYEDGVANIPTIEAATKKAFGVSMGMFELMNVSGIPIGVHGSNTLGREISPFYMTPKRLREQMELGEDWPLDGPVDESKFDQITEYLYGVTLGVAAKMVDEGVCSKEDAERGAKIGLRWAAGPFEMMNEIGIDKTLELVERISKRYEGFPVSDLLRRQAASGKPFTFQYVDYKVADGIANITINRPEAMNALNSTVVAQLEEAFNRAETDAAAEAIAIRGAGKAFVAGADIKFFVKNILNDTVQDSVDFTARGHKLLRRLECCIKPTIAVVDGLSLGGGSELALACQAIVATETASFGFPETGIGIYPGLGGMIRSARMLGTDLAKYYVTTGKTIRAQEAKDLGIITKLTTVDKLEDTIRELVQNGLPDKYDRQKDLSRFEEKRATMANGGMAKLLNGETPAGVGAELAEKTGAILKTKSPSALRYCDELMDAQAEVEIDEAIEIELSHLVEMFATEDALTGLSSPPGKPVKFTGGVPAAK